MQVAGCIVDFAIRIFLAGFGLLDSNAEFYFTGCCLLDAAS